MKHPADTTSKMTLTKVIRPELACQRHDSFPVTVWNVILEMAVNSNGGAKEKVWKTKANDQTAMMVGGSHNNWLTAKDVQEALAVLDHRAEKRMASTNGLRP